MLKANIQLHFFKSSTGHDLLIKPFRFTGSEVCNCPGQFSR